MTLGEKIKILREDAGMLQRQLASILEIGDAYLSKIEGDKKLLKRDHLRTISTTFQCEYTELETLWIANKVIDLVKNEEQGLGALRVAEEQLSYNKTPLVNE